MPATELTELLERGEITIKGRMPWSSNGTFLAEVCLAGRTQLGVYKPLRGERPLWDFPEGLGTREVAAYRLSAALGWDIVPETVWRTEGPMGKGSLQQFVEADFEHHYFTLYEEGERWHDQLRRICVFDLLANNTDRKSGHCLLVRDDGDGGHIYAIDNGLSFHAEPKLRTVIWDFGEEPIAAALLEDLRRLLEAGLPTALAELLDADEQRALKRRARGLLRSGHYPVDESGLRYPWPLI